MTWTHATLSAASTVSTNTFSMDRPTQSESRDGGVASFAKLVETPINAVSTDVESARCVCNGHAATIHGNKTTGAAIVGLFAHCGPHTVGRLVSEKVVDPLNLMAWRWSLPDICNERREIGSPLSADANALGAVVFEARMLRVQTPALDANPHTVFRRSVSSMLAVSRRGSVSTSTPTALGVSIPQARGPRDVQSAAIATTRPYRMGTRRKVSLQRSQSAEPLTGNVVKGAHT